MPETLKEASIIPLHKKDDKTECKSYRGNSQQSEITYTLREEVDLSMWVQGKLISIY